MNYQTALALVLLISMVLIHFPLPLSPLLLAALFAALIVAAFLSTRATIGFILIFLGVIAIAVRVPLPLPTFFSPLFRLAIVVGLWGMIYATLVAVVSKKVL